MQKELKELQPELIKTSAETDRLVTTIKGETKQVEAKREVLCEETKFTLCNFFPIDSRG